MTKELQALEELKKFYLKNFNFSVDGVQKTSKPDECVAVIESALKHYEKLKNVNIPILKRENSLREDITDLSKLNIKGGKNLNPSDYYIHDDYLDSYSSIKKIILADSIYELHVQYKNKVYVFDVEKVLNILCKELEK